MRIFAAALAAVGVLGIAFAALPAKAQDQRRGNDDTYAGVPQSGETIIVSPGLRLPGRLNSTPQAVTLSRGVPYGDLDLRTAQGAHELRTRVRSAATDICDRLREIYPHGLSSQPPCERSVLNNIMLRTDSIIANARSAGSQNGTYGGVESAPETVIVTRQFMRPGRLNGTPQAVSLSQTVSYADLDLRTNDGANEFRARIQNAAESVCAKLREIYQFGLSSQPPCVRSALNNTMLRVDSIIANVRNSPASGYYGGAEQR